MLAGVSIDYYTQLERGKLTGASDSVLDAIAGALQLDEAERAHLFGLARAANATVAILRTEAGRDPYDRALSDLIGQLCTRSEAFRERWAAHNVRLHRTGAKHFRHPAVGELSLAFEAMDLAADTGLTLTAYTAEPGSSSHDALKLLASWSATLDEAAASTATDGA